MCCLAGPFYQYLPLLTNDFEDGGRIKKDTSKEYCLGGQDFFFGGR
jgi:hypothetical protein